MSRTYTVILVSLLAAGLGTGLSAQDDPARQVADTVRGTVAVEQQTQAERDAWAEERRLLQTRYRAAGASVDHLTAQRDLQQSRVTAMNDRIAEFERRLNEADLITEGIQGTLDSVLVRLEEWVALDVPFLPEERATRLATLRDELARPDVTGADKLRRSLEALQIETAYGATVEVTQQAIDLDGEPLYVDVLRLGRLSLFCMTPDGERVGEYDRATASWCELPGKQRRSVMMAMEMAGRLRPAELIALPLGRIGR